MQQRMTVTRCIYHYSQGFMRSLPYRIQQWYKSYPDWIQSAKALDPNQCEVASLSVPNTVFYWFFRNPAVGEQNLRKLIQQNAKPA